MIDHPRVREQDTCPLCEGRKSPGLVACWSCYRQHLKPLWCATGDEARAAISKREQRLIEQGA